MHDSLPPSVIPPHLFRCERVTYSTVEADQIVDAAHYTTDTPLEAIRWVQRQVRDFVAQLPPGEAVQARRWDEGGGCIGSLAALHRGEACGFTLRHGDFWSEWNLRPRGEGDVFAERAEGRGSRCEGAELFLRMPDDFGLPDQL
ncbi:hypothetical protein [Streptomyces sp. NBC_00102]|uniref:hypothetical protein n=1 Tax=Streptomyces sp. NBC_00102 TaxID=2975652 RepID=UPI00224C879C|nr:hypothetical protein [Streptomyces sp. NBC_00102]MCX5397996.1 hypothetical protein [Streptomyces sp. NBC_00102]